MAVILALFMGYALFMLIYAIVLRKQEAASWRLAWLPLSLLIFVLSATRIGGSDWENYDYLYSYMANAESLLEALIQNAFFEPGYVALNYAFHTFTPDRRAMVVFESAINAYAMWAVLTRVRGGPILLIWLFPLQFANILGVRQTLATSLFIIAVTMLSGRASKIFAISSSLIHISSLVLVVGKAMEGFRLTWKRSVLMVLTIGGCALLVSDFLADKLTNYQENEKDLTNVSPSEILIGKGLTVLLLFAVHTYARHQPSDSVATLTSQRHPTALYLLYLVIIGISMALPPMTRLLTPLEFLIAWGACETVYGVRSQRTRVCLILLITVVAAAKMFKISSQLGDIYEVCFFCL